MAHVRSPLLIIVLLAVGGCEKLSQMVGEEPPREQQARRYLTRGREAIGRGDLVGAQQALEKAASLNPTDPEPQRSLGDVYERLGQEAQAIFALKRAAELTPGDPEPRRELAELYLRSGQPGPAAENLRKAVEASASPEPELLRRLASALLRSGQVEEAERVARQVEEMAGGDADILALLAEILLSRRDEEAAVRILDQALEGHPDSARVRAVRAKYFFSRGKVSEALREFELAADAAPDDTEIAIARARALAGARRHDEAVKLMDQIVAARPTDLSALASLAEVKLIAEDYDGAREGAEAVIARQPKNGRALYVRARALERQTQDDPVRAINAYRQVLEADPNQTEALSQLWRLYLQEGQKNDAIATLEQLVMVLHEDSPEEALQLAELYAETGINVPRGMRIVDQELKRDPGCGRCVAVRRALEHRQRTDGVRSRGSSAGGVQVIKGGR